MKLRFSRPDFPSGVARDPEEVGPLQHAAEDRLAEAHARRHRLLQDEQSVEQDEVDLAVVEGGAQRSGNAGGVPVGVERGVGLEADLLARLQNACELVLHARHEVRAGHGTVANDADRPRASLHRRPETRREQRRRKRRGESDPTECPHESPPLGARGSFMPPGATRWQEGMLRGDRSPAAPRSGPREGRPGEWPKRGRGTRCERVPLRRNPAASYLSTQSPQAVPSGAGGLDYRVRNGNGYDPSAIAAEKLFDNQGENRVNEARTICRMRSI